MFSTPTRWCLTQNSLLERWNKLSLLIISYQPKTGWWTCCVSRGSLEGSEVFAFSLLWLRYSAFRTPPPSMKEISRWRTWGNPDMDRSVELFIWNFLNTAFVRGFPARLELLNLPSHLFYNLRGPPPLPPEQHWLKQDHFWIKFNIGRQNQHLPVRESSHWSSTLVTPSEAGV